MNVKRYLSILIVALALVMPVPRAVAQDQTPPQLEYIDAQINVLLPRLIDFQKQYRDLTKNYYQALSSTSSIPAVPVSPDGIKGSPTDQQADLAYFWDSEAALPDVLAWSFRIDTYDGPTGPGYVLTVDTQVDGLTYERAINFGPEGWREYWWQMVKPEGY